MKIDTVMVQRTTQRLDTSIRTALPTSRHYDFDYAGGESLAPPARINRNDAQFTCAYGECDYDGPNYFNPDTYDAATSNLLNLDFVILHLPNLIDNLDRVTSKVQHVYKELQLWIRSLELQFESKVVIGEIRRNVTLFNKLSVAIPKIASAKKQLDAWYMDFQELVEKLGTAMQEYDMATAKLKSLHVNSTQVFGLPPDIIKVAKQNMSRSKAIQKQMQNMLVRDAQIRAGMQNVAFRIKELSVGLLRYGPPNNKTTLNLNTVVAAMQDLGEADSPLVKIQTEMSTLINSTPINLRMETAEVPLTDPKDVKAAKKPVVFSESYITDRLDHMRDTILYTTTTKKVLDHLQQHIETKLQDSDQYEAMLATIDVIRAENQPHILIEQLRRAASQDANIFLTVSRIKSLLENLQRPDIVYKESLQNILLTAKRTAHRLTRDRVSEFAQRNGQQDPIDSVYETSTEEERDDDSPNGGRGGGGGGGGGATGGRGTNNDDHSMHSDSEHNDDDAPDGGANVIVTTTVTSVPVTTETPGAVPNDSLSAGASALPTVTRSSSVINTPSPKRSRPSRKKQAPTPPESMDTAELAITEKDRQTSRDLRKRTQTIRRNRNKDKDRQTVYSPKQLRSMSARTAGLTRPATISEILSNSGRRRQQTTNELLQNVTLL